MDAGIQVDLLLLFLRVLLEPPQETHPPSIDILPTIFGERHSPDQRGTASNIDQVRNTNII